VARAAPLVVRALTRERGRTISFAAKTLEGAAAVVERVVRDPALAPLWSAHRLLREVPFLLPCGEHVISGTIDAIREDEQGALTIYDYKTESWAPSRRADLAEAHRTQALVYALAVTEIARRPVLGVRFLFLSAQPVAEVVYDVDARFLAAGSAIVNGIK
jgi:ATP-dependent exoDNAse (exonuclease V) beta subunit